MAKMPTIDLSCSRAARLISWLIRAMHEKIPCYRDAM